ncbi:MAG: acyl-CoA dehydrogenase family protein, partial [Acidimicrobiales bacterium]
YWAAWTLGSDDAADDERAIAASTAKSWCSDASSRVLASALQVHGGIGFTWDHDLHLYLKRAHLDAVAFGDATHHRARLAGLLRARVEGGRSLI